MRRVHLGERWATGDHLKLPPAAKKLRKSRCSLEKRRVRNFQENCGKPFEGPGGLGTFQEFPESFERATAEAGRERELCRVHPLERRSAAGGAARARACSGNIRQRRCSSEEQVV